MIPELKDGISRTAPAHILRGTEVGSGAAHGRLHFIRRATAATHAIVAVTADDERSRFDKAVRTVDAELRGLETRARESAGEDAAAIFEIHRMLLSDDEFRTSVERGILGGLSAEAAVAEAGESMAAVIESAEDEYLRERGTDIREVARRVVDALGGKAVAALTSPAVIAADEISPGDLLAQDRRLLLGAVSPGGSRSSHAAILARQLGIPMLISVEGLSAELDGTDVLLDADAGTLTLSPSLDEVNAFAERSRAERERRDRLTALAQLPAATLSGKQISVMANVGSVAEAEAAAAAGADGIGLFRSELMYLGRKAPPDEEEQLSIYRGVLAAMKGKPVIVRVLDAGADKRIPSVEAVREENPALGVRGIRFCFEHPELFRTQLRALCRASAHGDLRIMLPMVTSADEVRRARELIREVQNELRFEELDFSPDMPIGIMIETPAAALMCDELCDACDFFSVGTNDLCQYTLAADRQNEALSALTESMPEAVMRLIVLSSEAIKRSERRRWLGICGEAASDTSLTERFIALGADELSVAPPCIPELKEKIRAVD